MSEIQGVISERTRAISENLKDARIVAGRSIEECAKAIDATPEIIQEYEDGNLAPSLPELEGLAFFLDRPLDHFWESITKPSGTSKQHEHMALLIRIRHRMIGAMLRQARLEANLTAEQLARGCEIDVPTLEAMELGQQPVPVPLLEVFSGFLNRSIREFQDHHGPVGAWSTQQRALQEFTSMTPEMQEFISKSINRPYLELAMRLSEMSVERLRTVAEGLLEITY